jgi:hypothetical protein
MISGQHVFHPARLRIYGLWSVTVDKPDSLWTLQARGNEEDDAADDSAAYQLDMMRCLREVNVDNNTVGWYADLHFCIKLTPPFL